MKKLLALCLCVILILPMFSACGDESNNKVSAEKGFFIGTVKTVKSNNVEFEVYEDFTEKYGETVKLKKNGIGKTIEVGDEVKVTMNGTETVDSFTVLLQKKHSSGEASDRYGAFTVPKWADVEIPSDLLKINANEGELADYNCFSDSHVYRVIKQDAERTYLSRETNNIATFIVFGDLTNKCQIGDFVALQVSKHRWMPSNLYCTANAEDLTKIEIVDSLRVYNSAKCAITWDKPVIYLYPTKTETVDVTLNLKGKLTCTYPNYADGWNGLTVHTDGTIVKDDKEYYCLYWEGEGQFEADFTKGFCVKGEDTAHFLENTLKEIGLNDREANEFIIYWLPILQKNKYNLISFQGQNYVDAAALTVSPSPDSVLRVFMSFKPLEKSVDIEPQTFKPFNRNGFTVVEWGGGQAK